MTTGYFLIVITAMIGTFTGVGIADSGWLKKRITHHFLRYLIGLIIAITILCPFYFGV